MGTFDVLNPVSIWQGHVLVKRVFWVWAVLGNIAFEALLRHQIPLMELNHPRLTCFLFATGFYIFTVLLVYRGKNGDDIIFDTADQQKARYVWAVFLFGSLLLAVNIGLSVHGFFQHMPVNMVGSQAT